MESIFVVSGPAGSADVKESVVMVSPFNESAVTAAESRRTTESTAALSGFSARESTSEAPFTMPEKSAGGSSAQTKTKAKSIKNINVFFLTAAKLLIK